MNGTLAGTESFLAFLVRSDLHPYLHNTQILPVKKDVICGNFCYDNQGGRVHL